MSYSCFDTEPYALYREVSRTARKGHRCSACQEHIRPGYKYTAVHMVFDGTANTVKRCGRCQAIHMHLRSLDDEAWPDEWLNCGQSYESEWGECPDDVQALAFALPGEIA